MQIWGHRGAYRHMPENTLPGFTKAIELGADGVEFDVQLTRDGAVVVIHDETLDRTSTGSGLVRDRTLEELRRFNFNKRGVSEPKHMSIPTLDELLALLGPTSLAINIELKTGIVFYEGIERKTLDIVRAFGLLDRVLFSSFNHFSVQRLKALEPAAKTALLCGGGILVTGEQCAKVGACALHPDTRQMRYPGLIEDCHRRGVAVHAWTVDSEEDFAFANENGVDAVIVNDVGRFKR
jgi:glycerophosphoryl diester phosphodiesterase